MKRNVKALLVATIAWCAFSTSARATSTLPELRDYFEKLQDGPFTLLDAPRTGMGIGSTYIIAKGTTLYYTRPEDCFSTDLLAKTSGSIAIPNDQSTTADLNWDVGLKVAGFGPITDPLVAQMKSSDVRKVTLTMSELTRQMLTIPEAKKGLSTSADQDCISALRSNSGPKRFIVLETLTANSMSLTFKDSTGNIAKLSVGILSKIFPSFDFNRKNDWSGTIAFKNVPHIVAIKSVSVPDALAYAGGGIDLVYSKPDVFYSRAK